VPRQLEFFGDPAGPARFETAAARLAAVGGERVLIDFEPFLDAARLLYEGPWVSERYVAIKTFFDAHPQALHPVTREIIGGGVARTAAEVFAAQHRLQGLKRLADQILDTCDCVLTPTAGRAYTLAEIAAEPIKLNSYLGHYTNFMNLLDYAAVAVPMGLDAAGVPAGATLFGPVFSDYRLLHYAARYCAQALETAPEEGAAVPLRLVVCGAHLHGLPLNAQLTSRGARLVRATKTAPHYRLFALPGGPPARPGLVRDTRHGAAIEVEEWLLPSAQMGDFMAGIPAPLAIGRVELADGSTPQGFLCEGFALDAATEITHLGGWRRYLTGERV
jgi:allophanate hydrolase